jgi:hypothetical protein
MNYLLGFIVIFAILLYRATTQQRSHKRWRHEPDDAEMDYIEARRDDLSTYRGHYNAHRDSSYHRQQHTTANYNPHYNHEQEQDFFERSGELPDHYQPGYSTHNQHPHQGFYPQPYQQPYYPVQPPYQDPYRQHRPPRGYDPRYDRYPDRRDSMSGFTMVVGVMALVAIVVFFDIRGLAKKAGKTAPEGSHVIVIENFPEYPKQTTKSDSEDQQSPQRPVEHRQSQAEPDNASLYDPQVAPSRYQYLSSDMFVAKLGSYDTAEEAFSKTECLPAYRIEVVKIGEEYWPCIFWGATREGIETLKKEIRANKAELADFQITKVSILKLSDFCDGLKRRNGTEVWIGE